jgi:hypothetical protein
VAAGTELALVGQCIGCAEQLLQPDWMYPACPARTSALHHTAPIPTAASRPSLPPAFPPAGSPFNLTDAASVQGLLGRVLTELASSGGSTIAGVDAQAVQNAVAGTLTLVNSLLEQVRARRKLAAKPALLTCRLLASALALEVDCARAVVHRHSSVWRAQTCVVDLKASAGCDHSTLLINEGRGTPTCTMAFH